MTVASISSSRWPRSRPASGAGAGYSAINAYRFHRGRRTNLFGAQAVSLRWEFGKHANNVEFGFSQDWPSNADVSRRRPVQSARRSQIKTSTTTARRRFDHARAAARLLDYTRASSLPRESVKLYNFASSYTGSLRNQKCRRNTFAPGDAAPRLDRQPLLRLRVDRRDQPDLFGTVLGGDESTCARPQHRCSRTRHLETSLMLRRGSESCAARRTAHAGLQLWRLGGNRYLGVRGYEDGTRSADRHAAFRAARR